MAFETCDQLECKEPATHSYTWEWGASGVCCAKHLVVLQQTAVNLGRSIQFSLLNAGGTAPLQREERVKLRAEAMVLGEELEETKTRGLELYRQNTALTAQVQSLTVRSREAEAQRKDAVIARDEMEARLAKLETENANLSDELSRVRVLLDVPFEPGTNPGVGVLPQ
jgi:septal ring factor EnvC (AmiA/AmiB activator)